MKGVRFVKAEYAALTSLIKERLDFVTTKDAKLLGSVLAKLEKANDGQPAGVFVPPLEQALVSAARGKAIPTTPGGHARASKQALAVGATVESMAEVGLWLSRQKWLYEPVTILTVLNKWPEWYPKAKATAAPKGISEGLGGVRRETETGNMGQGTSSGSSSAQAGRPKEGVR